MMSNTTYDLELALTDQSHLNDALIANLRSDFILEDRSKQGWGLVLRLEKSESTSLDELMRKFLPATLKFKHAIKEAKPILRVAALNPNATCTLLLKDLSSLAELGVQIEVSVYPA